MITRKEYLANFFNSVWVTLLLMVIFLATILAINYTPWGWGKNIEGLVGVGLMGGVSFHHVYARVKQIIATFKESD